MRHLLSVLLILLTAACVTGGDDRRARSPHFDGEQFNNPVRGSKTLWDFLKMRLRTDYADWPDWVASDYRRIKAARVLGSELHVTHINHSTVLIQTAGLNVLTDPIYSRRCSPVSWAGPERVRNPGVRFEDLPKIDVVVLSHDHYDHLDLDTMAMLIERDDPQILMGLGVAERFAGKGRLVELDWWEAVTLADGSKIHFVPVQHFSGRTPFDRNSTLWGGFYLQLGERAVYFGGDTGYAEHFKETRQRLGAPELAILPIGAYAPRSFMAYAHIDPAEAVKAHLDLEAKRSIGVHYGTFQLTAEEYGAPLEELRQALEASALPAEAFLTPSFGETLVL